jgi:hypothetical protein
VCARVRARESGRESREREGDIGTVRCEEAVASCRTDRYEDTET